MKVDDTLVLYNKISKINRPVRIKRINKDSIVFDYGEHSNFDIKYLFKTGRPIEDLWIWNDFEINDKDLNNLKELENKNIT
jgi:hypothetical protein